MTVNVALFTDDGQQVSSVDFESVKLGNQSLIKHYLIKNVGNQVIESLQVQAYVSEVEQIGSAEETYNATFLSRNGRDFRLLLNYKLEIDESADLYLKWKPPSYLKLNNAKEHKNWGLKFVIASGKAHVESICGT